MVWNIQSQISMIQTLIHYVKIATQIVNHLNEKGEKLELNYSIKQYGKQYIFSKSKCGHIELEWR